MGGHDTLTGEGNGPEVWPIIEAECASRLGFVVCFNSSDGLGSTIDAPLLARFRELVDVPLYFRLRALVVILREVTETGDSSHVTTKVRPTGDYVDV